jgi:hypothetical protein
VEYHIQVKLSVITHFLSINSEILMYVWIHNEFGRIIVRHCDFDKNNILKFQQKHNITVISLNLPSIQTYTGWSLNKHFQ